MCGIAGRVNFKNQPVKLIDIDKMCDSIKHRGPDDFGNFISQNNKIGLGNRRLAIIDLSNKGHQPMSYLNRYTITTNGEIYNYLEEKEKLVKLGYKFTTNCDTEVILALYDKYAEGCLGHLRGMFAFAIFDRVRNTLFLARDRIGKKPLKYFLTENVFLFASEIKALFTQGEVKKEPDFNALAKYLTYGYIPSPLTGFKNIYKLPPGHFIKVDIGNRKVEIKKYWEPQFNSHVDLSENEWCDQIISTLNEATKLRMRSDVPFGAFLSGGVDSSAVVSAMAINTKKPIKTFTVTFEEKDWNEARYAKNIVDLYKTDHIELPVSCQNIEYLEEICQNFDEPFADAGVILSYLVSALAKKHATVVLNGDGGDELFAGYPNRYFRLKRDVDYDKYLKLLRTPATIGLSTINKLTDNRKVSKIIKFLNKSKHPLYERFASYNQIFSKTEISEITKGELHKVGVNRHYLEEVVSIFDNFEGNDFKDAGLKFDQMYWLPDDLLAKADMSSMASSLEARSPLLDTKMIELANLIPYNLKVKNGQGKYIFKKALEGQVPKENLYHSKRGFGLPLHKWFSGDKNLYMKSILLSKNTKTKEFIKQEYVKTMFAKHSKSIDFGPKLWSLLTLELWYKTNFK